MAGDQLARFRAAVDDETTGEQLAAVVDGVEAAGHHVDGDRMRTRPRGVAPDHPRLDLLRLRTITATHQFGPEPWLQTQQAADVVARTWREMGPLDDWLARNVGPSHLPRR
jgi:hypothetical protein